MTVRYPSWPYLAGILAMLVGIPIASGDTYSLFIGPLVAVYAIAGLGVSIVVGCCREVSIGHSAFFAVGAYAYALSSRALPAGEWIGLLLALALGGMGGLAFGLLTHRLTGQMFALATLCLAIIAEQVGVEWKSVTGGFGGLPVQHRPRIGGWEVDLQTFYLATAALAAAACFAYHRLPRSDWGRAFYALGDDPLALESVGHSKRKVISGALALSGAITACAGWIFAPATKFVSPDALAPQLALAFLLVALLGGSRHPCGPIIGAVVVVVLPECLRSIPNSKLLVNALALMTAVYFLPRGLAELLVPPEQDAIPAPPAVDNPNEVVQGQDLEVRNLTVRFDGVVALASVSAMFRAGTITYLVGPNGAGKTTLLNAIVGNVSCPSGTILLRRRPVSSDTAGRASRDGIARTFQHPRLFNSLAPLDNVLVGILPLRWVNLPLSLIGLAPSPDLARRAGQSLAEFGYHGDLNHDVAALPFGSLRAIELARAAALRPAVLLLDEPSSGVDGEELDELIRSLNTIRKSGVTTIVVTHEARLIQKTADQVIILEEGNVTYSGPLAECSLAEHVYIDPDATA